MIKKELVIDLEKEPNFEFASLMESITLNYRGHSITPHMNRSGELVYKVKSHSQDYPVMHNIKSVKISKMWIDNAIKRTVAFKPFTAYMEQGGRIMLIKVNSLSKDGTEFNATLANEDGERYISGERFTVKKFAKLYKLNPKNKAIVQKIRAQERTKAIAQSTIYKLEQELESDDTVGNYFREMKKEPETSIEPNG